jgi:hypothetical protein
MMANARATWWRKAGWAVVLAAVTTIASYLVSWSGPAPSRLGPAIVWWAGVVGFLAAMALMGELSVAPPVAITLGFVTNVAALTLLFVGIGRLVSLFRRKHREPDAAA